MRSKVIRITVEVYEKLNDLKFQFKAKSLNDVLVSLVHNQKAASSKASEVWNAYANAYNARYKVDAVRNAKQNRLCQELVKRVGHDKAIEVTAFYLNINDGWIISKQHPLEYLVKNCEGIVTRMERGVSTITQNQVKQAERNSEFASYLNKIKKDEK